MPNLEELLQTYGRIPDLTSFRRPLFIGPHPDDIEFGCGALISRYRALGVPVTCVIVTDGGAGSPDRDLPPEALSATRREESLAAAAVLGIEPERVLFLNLEDGGTWPVEDAVRLLAPVILRFSPDVLFAPDSRLRTECHGDHIKTGEAVRRLTQIVSYPETLRRHGVDISAYPRLPSAITLALYFTDEPNTLVPVTPEDLNAKLQALQCHRSQMQGQEAQLLLGYFQLKAQKLGQGSGTGLAEDYPVLLPLMQHVYSEGVNPGQ